MDFISILPIYAWYVLYSCLLLVVFALWLFLACLGKLLATRGRYWFLGFFSGDSGCVLGVLGFLLPPTPFVGYRFLFVVEPRVGMGMLVMFRFSERFLCLELLRPGLCF